ncbi:MAG: M13-type metalloendopeptidase [Planctomycetota bacterium]
MAMTSTVHGTEPKSEKTSGINQKLIADSIRSGDDFYRYANQRWLDATKIPADKSNYGIFTVLDDKTRFQVRSLIETAAEASAKNGSAAQKVGDLYLSVLNTEARNEAGIKPVLKLITRIDRARNKADLVGVMGMLSRNGVSGPFGFYVNNDAKKSDRYAVYVTQSGLTLPDRDYYLEDDKRYQKLRAELKEYIALMLGHVGTHDPSSAAEIVFQIESKIAQYHWTNTENRDPVKTYNKMSSDEVQALMTNVDWGNYAEACGIQGEETFVVRQPSYLEALGSVYDDFTLQQWKYYLRFHAIDAYAGSLTEELESQHFSFHSTAISGITEQEPMWKRGVGVTGSALGELVGQLYVEKHFKPAAKARMNELVENLKRAFKIRIEKLDWMGKGTKKQAIEKLSMFTTKIGYPDQWKDYEKLRIDSPVLAENLMASAQFEHQRELNKLGSPIDRSEWYMTPQTINAYYNPVMNEIVFPAAILQPPFFDMAADDAANYGGIGAVIGHELSHGFDDKGSKYDGNGNLRMWWTENDREEFDERATKLVDQYNEFEPVEGNPVNGKLTLGENIGDLGGLNVAYEAYQLSLDGKPAPIIDGLTGDQRFFLGWAQIWRRLYRQPELLKRLITDPHSPSEYRVNGIVRNMDEWYDAFSIQSNDSLFLKPEERVKIW